MAGVFLWEMEWRRKTEVRSPKTEVGRLKIENGKMENMICEQRLQIFDLKRYCYIAQICQI